MFVLTIFAYSFDQLKYNELMIAQLPEKKKPNPLINSIPEIGSSSTLSLLTVDTYSDVITNTKLIDINEAWEKEYEKYYSYIKGDLDSFYQNVKLVNSIISIICYEDFAIELTPSSTIKYSLLLPDKKKLIIKKYFEKYEDKAENDVIFSIFDNKKLILSDTKDLNELVSGINRYIQM